MAGKVEKTSPTKEQSVQNATENETIPSMPPLRRPHSPAVKVTPRKDEDTVTAAGQTSDHNGPRPQNNANARQNNANNGPRNFNNRQDNRQDNNRRTSSFPKQFDNRQNKGGQTSRQNGQQEEGEARINKNVKPQRSNQTTPPVPPPVLNPVGPVTPASAPKLQNAPKPRMDPESPKAVQVKPASKPPGSLSAATPAKSLKKHVPQNYLIEVLSVGDMALLSVEGSAADCRSTRPGFVCLSMHERFEKQYQDLCEVYTVDCEADTKTITPSPGECFSYFNRSDGGWYRARCLTPGLAALVDSGKVVPLAPEDGMKALPDKYKEAPEFCCLLNGGSVEIGDNLKCKLLSKTADGYKVALEKVDSGTSVGEGEVSRWSPTVEHAEPTPVQQAAAQSSIPEVIRPDLVNNSTVLLVDATGFDRVFVRPGDTASQRRFDQILQDVVLFGRDASPLKEPPLKGQVVIGKFSDGLFYRALCKRTNIKQNKYMLEYIEFGNVEVTQLENIYPCPANLDLSTRPTEASMVTLQCEAVHPFSEPAVKFLEVLKDNLAELTLTVPSGGKTAASGSAVHLTDVAKNESVNRKLEKMCTPEWKKMEEAGADVVELKALMYADLEWLELPANGCELDILDVSTLQAGTVSGCQSGRSEQTHVLTRLTEQMTEYCNSELGRKPYLPKHEELCIARYPPYPQWFRAVLVEQSPGSPGAQVCYVDYGNVNEVPVELLRKMLPEFVRGHPALAMHLEIKDFPKQPTNAMLARAVEHMKVNVEGRGTLAVTRCERQDAGMYVVHAPRLIEAMTRQ